LNLEPRKLSREHGFVSLKKQRIGQTVRRFEGQKYDPHYLGFFDCFNRGEFYEAHEVLEKIWLPQRSSANGRFYKGLIQLAGAFVHLQKGRLRPAGALLKLAKENLETYGAAHQGLDLNLVGKLVTDWLEKLEAGQFETNPLAGEGERAPRLELKP
jgi:predicted metal-dependent hydrolase